METIDFRKSSIENLDADTSTSESPSFATENRTGISLLKILMIPSSIHKSVSSILVVMMNNDDTSFDQDMDDFGGTVEWTERCLRLN